MENPVYYQIVMTDQAALIQDLFSEETASLQGVMETVRLSDGELLFSRGDSGDAFYIIETGHIRIFTLAEGEQELTLNTLGPGEVFGEMALVDDQPRSASAVAVGPATLRRLRREDFLAGIRSSPALSLVIIQLLNERARYLIDYIERLGHWTKLVAEGQYDQVMRCVQADVEVEDRVLASVADAMRRMVQAVQEREVRLREEVAQLRVQVDETKRKRQVAEITETVYFQELAQQARRLREQAGK